MMYNDLLQMIFDIIEYRPTNLLCCDRPSSRHIGFCDMRHADLLDYSMEWLIPVDVVRYSTVPELSVQFRTAESRKALAKSISESSRMDDVEKRFDSVLPGLGSLALVYKVLSA